MRHYPNHIFFQGIQILKAGEADISTENTKKITLVVRALTLKSAGIELDNAENTATCMYHLEIGMKMIAVK